jgi:hypothetical protein
MPVPVRVKTTIREKSNGAQLGHFPFVANFVANFVDLSRTTDNAIKEGGSQPTCSHKVIDSAAE